MVEHSTPKILASEEKGTTIPGGENTEVNPHKGCETRVYRLFW